MGTSPRPCPLQSLPAEGDAALPPASDDTPANYRQPWSDEEDARATEMAVHGNPSKHIAEQLGRPAEGTRYRLQNKLRHVIEAAKRPKDAAPVAAPIAQVSIQVGSSGLREHLVNLPRKQGWTLTLDAELMRQICVGRRFLEIEADLGLSKVKERFEM